ncbi:unnamed protein product [Leptidea sinapis]|uniref:Uncharacterized protein n=1 Tax=Leptidea sinapis TaxID=189913 RepID=A0A5E4Q696_9NEOP|nr:unnamed protein product [Leptidea sinapis]VVC93277.1 unnamed protein product [Leptidea sinapis]
MERLPVRVSPCGLRVRADDAVGSLLYKDVSGGDEDPDCAHQRHLQEVAADLQRSQKGINGWRDYSPRVVFPMGYPGPLGARRPCRHDRTDPRQRPDSEPSEDSADTSDEIQG